MSHMSCIVCQRPTALAGACREIIAAFCREHMPASKAMVVTC